jgi:hypothetical protein
MSSNATGKFSLGQVKVKGALVWLAGKLHYIHVNGAVHGPREVKRDLMQPLFYERVFDW